jgi:hypothetical protein
MKKVTESIRVEDRTKTELIKLGGEFQTAFGRAYTYSDTIDELVAFYREKKRFEKGA